VELAHARAQTGPPRASPLAPRGHCADARQRPPSSRAALALAGLAYLARPGCGTVRRSGVGALGLQTASPPARRSPNRRLPRQISAPWHADSAGRGRPRRPISLPSAAGQVELPRRLLDGTDVHPARPVRGRGPRRRAQPSRDGLPDLAWADRSGPRQPPPGRWRLDSCPAALCRWLERGPRGGGRKRQRRRRLALGIGRRAGGCLRRHGRGHTRCRSTEHDDGRNAHPSLDRPGVGSLVNRRLGRVGLRRWRTARCERRSPRRAPDRGPQSERSARSQVDGEAPGSLPGHNASSHTPDQGGPSASCPSFESASACPSSSGGAPRRSFQSPSVERFMARSPLCSCGGASDT
jgi:hypothetical protein